MCYDSMDKKRPEQADPQRQAEMKGRRGQVGRCSQCQGFFSEGWPCPQFARGDGRTAVSILKPLDWTL